MSDLNTAGMETMGTAEAIAALQAGRHVFAPGLTMHRVWWSRKPRSRLETKAVAEIGPVRQGAGYAVTFADGSARVVLDGATFWVQA